jgi:hypothetical protein
MTWEEALRVLGISQDVGFKDARRAYLQLIKVHKPEQDPEGFQRVRQAFEMIAPALQAREHAGSVQRLLELEPVALQTYAVASQSEPPPSAADQTAADQTSVQGPSAEESSSPDNAVLEYDEAEQRVARWAQLVHAHDLGAAVPEVLRSLELAARFPLEVRLPGDLLLRVIGELAARGECIRARQVTEGVRGWLQALPSARQAFSTEGRPRWVLLDELVRAEQAVSAATFEALAKAITLDGEDALKGLELRQILNPAQSREDHLALLRPAPTLAKTFGKLLDPPAPDTGTSGGSWSGWWRWAWVLLVLSASATRNCGSFFTDEHQGDRYVPPAPPPRSAPARLDPSPPAPGEVDSATVEEVGQMLASALAAAGDETRPDDAVDGLLHGECDQAGTALADLAKHAHPLGVEARDGLKALWAEFEVKCPGQMKRYEP